MPVGFQNADGGVTWLLRGAFVFGDQSAEDRAVLDPLMCEIDGWTVGSWRLLIECPVRSSAVVVAGIFVDGSAQVSLVEDEHAVGYLGADGENEPLGVCVGRRRQLHLIWMVDADGCG
jgi:hypothetical protein